MSVASIRQKTAQRMGDGAGDGDGQSYACNTCGMSTAYATLSSYGARCFPCYQAYCREGPAYPAKVDLPPFEASSPKSWAYKLREREKRGDDLTLAQREIWRACLGTDGQPAGNEP